MRWCLATVLLPDCDWMVVWFCTLPSVEATVSHFTHLTSNYFSLILCTRQCFYWTLNWFQQVLIVRGLCLCFQPKLDDISQGRRAPPAGSTAAKIPPEVSFPKKYFTQWYFWLFFHSTSYLLFPENLPVLSRNETLMHRLVSLRVPF